MAREIVNAVGMDDAYLGVLLEEVRRAGYAAGYRDGRADSRDAVEAARQALLQALSAVGNVISLGEQ